jgi:hypothetical protein
LIKVLFDSREVITQTNCCLATVLPHASYIGKQIFVSKFAVRLWEDSPSFPKDTVGHRKNALRGTKDKQCRLQDRDRTTTEASGGGGGRNGCYPVVEN